MADAVTILIVDDFESDRLICRRYIQKGFENSHHILEADSISQAIEIWRSHRPDVTIVDFNLRDGNGLIFLESIRQDILGDQDSDRELRLLDPKLPVIMLTGNGDERVAVNALKLGAFDYLVKNDITEFSLCQSVQSLLENIALRSKLERSQKREALVTRISLNIRQFINLEDICQMMTQEILQLLKADRTLIYKFNQDLSRRIIAEALVEPWQSCHNAVSESNCMNLSEDYARDYRAGQVLVTPDIHQAQFAECHVQMLQTFQVKANIVVPILLSNPVNHNSHNSFNHSLWGLLIVHQCSATRVWINDEIQLLQQLAVQLAIAIQQAEIYRNLQSLNNSLEIQVQERTAELQMSEQKSRSILTALPDIINLINAEGFYLESRNNSAIYNLFPDHIDPVGKHILEILPADIAIRQLQAVQQAAFTKEIQIFEQSFEIDNHIVYEEVRVVPVQKDILMIVIRDISDRKYMEGALKNELLRNKNLLHTSFDGIFFLDNEGNIVESNPSLATMLGYTLEEITQLSIYDIDVRWNKEELTKGIEEFKAGKRVKFETRYRKKDGSICYVEISANSVTWDDTISQFCICRDITQRKINEDILQQTIQREKMVNQFIQTIRSSLDLKVVFKAATNTIPNLLNLDQAVIVQYVAERRVWEYVAVFRNDSDTFDKIGLEIPDEGNPFGEKLRRMEVVQVADTREIDDLINREIAQRKVGAWLLVPIIVNGLTWGSFSLGRPYNVSGWEEYEVELAQTIANQLAIAIQQVTLYEQLQLELIERKQTEIALAKAKDLAEAANRAKSEFLANMSHEIRTPMNGVIGMAQLLATTTLRNDQKNFVQIILDSGDALLTVINDILDLSKIESGKLQLEAKAFNFADILNSACNLLSKQAFDKDINLQYQINKNIPNMVIGDSSRLRQVLINLIGNAVKFTKQGAISISVDGSFVTPMIYEFRFAIADTGIGIDGDRIHNLFSPFTQADASINRQFGGTGLGLAICKRLIEMMNGTIWVESRGNVAGKPIPNWVLSSDQNTQGSTFYFAIALPVNNIQKLVKATASLYPSNLDIKSEQRPIKILIVEDNLLNQKITKLMLKKLGYEADVVGNGQECINLLSSSESEYELVFMDVQMPIMDGVTATKIIRKNPSPQNKPWIVALTADALAQERQACIDAGMNDFISKPVRMQEVIRALSEYNQRLQHFND